MSHLDQQTATTMPLEQPSKPSNSGSSLWNKLRGGALLTIGFLLSPLSWWNDLIFNLPVAYGFGYLCSRVVSDWLIPGTIVGYWISNILGILLMQAGALDLAQRQPTQRNFKKELLTGVVSSTIYTLLIVGLVHFHVLETPLLFASEQLSSLTSWLP
ncbi:hypothetical protein ACN4EK_20525 [Pantanalinema rosaneae CENA516]|uniref:hypothetical protein n=1 Tax=Pantanalinema rosaneae TaxID=1620701 RepID=UPI003D6F6554